MGERTPLYDALTAHIRKGNSSFHTPGHKGRGGKLHDLEYLAYDTTELPETGSLFDGGDAIEAAEICAAEAFNADMTFFSAGGCTLCIQTMLFLTAAGKKRIIMARHTHRSAVNTVALLGLEIVWLTQNNFTEQTTVLSVKKALADAPDAAAVYLTSPNYFGNLADIRGIAEVCNNVGIPLLVDNAHGSHLGAFGLHPLSLGAYMTADSSHKTMPVLTGGAMLHLSDETHFSRDHVKSAMSLFASTSPPFPILASLDIMCCWWQSEGISAFKEVARQVHNIECSAAQTGILPMSSEARDPTRLTLNSAAAGMAGETAADYFRAHGCEPEYYDYDNIVFIITPFNTQDEITRLKHAVEKFPVIAPLPTKNISVPPSERMMIPRDAILSPYEYIDISCAIGRINASVLCPCPPGIPILLPGDKINSEAIQMLKSLGYIKIKVVK